MSILKLVALILLLFIPSDRLARAVCPNPSTTGAAQLSLNNGKTALAIQLRYCKINFSGRIAS